MTTNEMDRILFNMPISHLQKISHATCNYDCTGYCAKIAHLIMLYLMIALLAA